MSVTPPEEAVFREYSGWSLEGRKLRQEALDKKICAYCKKPFDNNRVKYWCSAMDTDCSSKFYWKYFITWSTVRDKALERDNHKCVLCKQTAKDVHHIKPISKDGKIFDLDNLISLCYDCHRHKHKTNHHQKNKINPDGVIMQLVLPQQYFYHKITDYVVNK